MCSIVCSKKSTKLMIPAKTSCPKLWTREYYGYLVTEYHGHPRNAVYECVDKDPDHVLDSQKNTDKALLYFATMVFPMHTIKNKV